MHYEDIYTLFDDASVREKLKVMSKWDALMDDARNPHLIQFNEELEDKLTLGKSYKIVITVIEVPQYLVVRLTRSWINGQLREEVFRTGKKEDAYNKCAELNKEGDDVTYRVEVA